MSYTIQQVANMTGIPATTLRYYDKEGLLPFLERRSSGYREFSDIDLASLQIVQCLKATGMSVAEMKQFSDWVRGGDATLKERLDMFLRRKEAVERQIEELQRSLAVINYKCDYYSRAVEAGTEKDMLGKDKLPYYEEFLKRNDEAGKVA
ncbi:MerR family transcriptional regulator [uncultured Cloacibacillus sp.]|uniref:MerR family transcriptional regulator n=1 Tax=uncultured Cloacibacillus sp. TaxID=889794 RepID=UPI002607680F|nr:MerR family transcriptional regulator [uncultured Cloacibacillus sp.]